MEWMRWVLVVALIGGLVAVVRYFPRDRLPGRRPGSPDGLRGRGRLPADLGPELDTEEVDPLLAPMPGARPPSREPSLGAGQISAGRREMDAADTDREDDPPRWDADGIGRVRVIRHAPEVDPPAGAVIPDPPPGGEPAWLKGGRWRPEPEAPPPGAAPAAAEPPPRLNAALTRAEAPVQAVPPPPRAAPPRPAAAVISLTLVAREAPGFRGADLLELAQTLDLRLGPQGFFDWCFEQGQIGFSLLNGVAPGRFEASSLDELVTPALSLFMQLPGDGDDYIAWSRMLMTAERLAQALDAVLLDEQRQPFDEESRRRQERLVLGEGSAADPSGELEGGDREGPA